MAEKSSWDQANRRQKLGLVWRIRKKISQIIKDYFYLPFFLLIILWRPLSSKKFSPLAVWPNCGESANHANPSPSLTVGLPISQWRGGRGLPSPYPNLPPNTVGQPTSLWNENENFGGGGVVLNFENDDSELAVKILFCLRNDSASFHFYCHFHLSLH